MKLSKEELIVGALHGVIAVPFIGWLSLIVIPACSFLWAAGGSESFNTKAWRRAGVPVVIGIAIGIMTGAFIPAAIGSLAAFGVLSIGYGIQTGLMHQAHYDEGSFLGRIVYKLIDGEIDDVDDQRSSTIILRSILYVLFGACYHIPLLFA